MKIRAVGQATFVVTMTRGEAFVLDPWFSENLLARRALPLPAGLDRLPECRAVLCSHNHVDHVDGASLRAAAAMKAILVGPSGVVRRGRMARIPDCRRLRRGERTDLDGVVVEAVFATHPLCVAPVGYLVTDVDGTTLYHSGDTRYDARIVSDIAGRVVDAACLQIAAARYPIIGRDGMDASDAARLAGEISAKVAIPMHFHVQGKVEDPRRFASAAGSRARVLAPGESLEVAR